MTDAGTTFPDVARAPWTVRRWGASRGWVTAHAFGINAFVFSAFCVVTVGDVYFNGGTEGRQANALAYVLLVGQTLPLAFRLRYPIYTGAAHPAVRPDVASATPSTCEETT